MRPLQKLFSLQMKDNKIRPSSNPQMKKTNETNDELSKQIQEDEKKQDNDANNDELFPRSPKNLKQSDKDPLSHGDENENVTGQLKCNRWLLKYSAATDADWRWRALNQFDDGGD